MKIDVVKNQCCNCKACVCACPTNAIKMQYVNDDVFEYPVIDNEKCIDCGKCAQVCPALDESNTYERKKCFYGQHKNDEIRGNSSSGGAFRALADTVINENGVVVSAYMDYEKMEVVFGSTENISIEALMKSKYVESNVRDSYKTVKEYLKSDKSVLFCGTPCQVAGLQKYLGKVYEKLLTVDFICHGVPAQKYFKEHCDTLERKYQSKINKFDFRPKTLGWTPQCLDIGFENGKNLDIAFINDTYFFGFMSKNVFLRKCCYSCKFANNHKADVTIADFWGHSKSGLNVKNDEKGMSLIICNSNKGVVAVEKVKEVFELNECDVSVSDYAVKEKKQKPQLMEQREQFIKLVNEVGFEKAAEKTYMLKPLQNFMRKVNFKLKLLKKG